MPWNAFLFFSKKRFLFVLKDILLFKFLKQSEWEWISIRYGMALNSVNTSGHSIPPVIIILGLFSHTCDIIWLSFLFTDTSLILTLHKVIYCSTWSVAGFNIILNGCKFCLYSLIAFLIWHFIHCWD